MSTYVLMASRFPALALGFRFTQRVQYENPRKNLIPQINRCNIKYENINDSRKHLATKVLILEARFRRCTSTEAESRRRINSKRLWTSVNTDTELQILAKLTV